MTDSPRREHLFYFPDEARALLFVRRLCLEGLHSLAIHRGGKWVKVIDGSDRGQGERIAQLAKMSGFVPRVD